IGTWCARPRTASAICECDATICRADAGRDAQAWLPCAHRPRLSRMTATDVDIEQAVLEACSRAKVASRALATATRATKDAALEAMADARVANAATLVEANAKDVQRGRENDMKPGLLDRLTLTPERIGAIADALRYVATLPDPIGEVRRGSTLPNGLRLIEKQ